MAKLTLTFEDSPDGTIAFNCSPEPRRLLQRFKDLNELTKAEKMVVDWMLLLAADEKRSKYKSRIIHFPDSQPS